ncbi:MAG: hypothetical protein SGILL_001176 [Bacillariaceae sp.]
MSSTDVNPVRFSGDSSSEDGEPSIQLTRTTRSNGDVSRVIASCDSAESPLACKNRLLNTAADGSLRFIHYLQESHAYASEIKTSHLGDIEGLQEDPIRETMHLPESLEILHGRDLQSSSQTIPYGVDLVRAREAWEEFGTKGENVRVCVMDTGVWRGHDDLDELFGPDGNTDLVQPWFRDVNGHGTHCTGTIAASDNNLGVVGVAPDVEIFIARVFSPNGEFHSSDMIAGLEACRDGGANVISMSLGGPFPGFQEEAMFRSLYNQGIVSVAAAGNTGRLQNLYPAAYDNVISVAAVNSNRDHASFSTRNNMVDVAAPGVSVISTWENNRYASLSGTSMACPHVAGVVALMLSAVPNSTPGQVFNAITSSATNPNTSSRDSSLGYGVVDAVAAIEALASGSSGGGGSDTSPPNPPPTSPPNNGGGGGGNNDEDCVDLMVTLQTDRFGGDTSHWLQSDDGDVLFFRNGLPSFETFEETACIVPFGCYTYQIRDAFCDGIQGEGLEIRFGDELVYQGGSFGCGGFRQFGNGCST